jgi:hypothetical protein
MRIRLEISIIISLLVMAVMSYCFADLFWLPDFYAKNMRASFFTGFLTIGSFLLSLKIFIVIKLKENIYDSKEYRDNFENKKKIDNSLTIYGPLKRLSDLLFVTISSAIVASVFQLSVGLIDNCFAVLLCIFMAVFSFSMLVMVLCLIRSILNDWFDYLGNNK